MADVRLHPDVDKYLSRRPNDVEDRIRDKLDDAGGDPGRFLDPLQGQPRYKLRIGDYRAIIEWDKDDDELLVWDVDTRDTVYDR